MFVKAPNRTLKVFVKHRKNEPLDLPNGKIAMHHTDVTIKTEQDVELFKVVAHCSSGDNFCYRVGCKEALKKAFAQDTDHTLSKEERTAIFARVCPKFAKV